MVSVRQEVNDTMQLDANSWLAQLTQLCFCRPCVRVFIGQFVSNVPYWLQKNANNRFGYQFQLYSVLNSELKYL